MSEESISLIVAVYERARVLELVLASLEQQSFSNFEVVLADDGSSPEIASIANDWVERAGRPVRHIWHEDKGFRKTIVVNQAVAKSTGDYLIFMDGDCILHHRFVERHFARRRRGRALSGRRVMLDAALTARVTLDDVRSRRIERPSFWWRHAPAHDRRNGVYVPAAFGWRGGFNPRYEILGCNFSLYRGDFLKVNGYDERIVGRGMEDVNLRTRLLNSGVSVHSISQEALQFHCQHGNDGFPHDPEAVERWRDTKEIRAPRGVIKSSSTRGRTAGVLRCAE